MATWRRAEPVSVSTGLALGLVITGLVFTSVITIVLVADSVHWYVNPVLGTLGIYGFMFVWTGLAWRLYRTGLYVSDQAIRVMYPWRNRVFRWADVATITSRPAMAGRWTTSRDTICLNLANGDTVETSVRRGTNGYNAGARRIVGPVLGTADFDATVRFLREMRSYAEARGAAGTPPGLAR
jgi:hypothetical protein